MAPMTNVQVQRDGLTLRGVLEIPEGKDKYDMAILMHGFTGNCGRDNPGNLHYQLAQMLKKMGIASVRFDFNGHGQSDGSFTDMTVMNEVSDGRAILDYVRQMPQVEHIYLLGHSQGGVVASMLAGYYHEYIDRLVLMAPAATLKTDALAGHTQGLIYDPQHIPDKQHLRDHYDLGGFYLRIAQTLPIYETAGEYHGPVCLIHGTADQVVDPHASIKYDDGYSNSTLHLIEGAGHLLDGERRQKVLNIVSEFIK